MISAQLSLRRSHRIPSGPTGFPDPATQTYTVCLTTDLSLAFVHFPTGWAIVCGMEVRCYRNEDEALMKPKIAQTSVSKEVPELSLFWSGEEGEKAPSTVPDAGISPEKCLKGKKNLSSFGEKGSGTNTIRDSSSRTIFKVSWHVKRKD